jgi:hypothetical protein
MIVISRCVRCMFEKVVYCIYNSCVTRDSPVKLKERFLNKHFYVQGLCRDKLNCFEIFEEKLNCVLGLRIFSFFSTRAPLSMVLASWLMFPFCPILRCLHITLSSPRGFLHRRIGFQGLHCRMQINSETKTVLDNSSSFFTNSLISVSLRVHTLWFDKFVG